MFSKHFKKLYTLTTIALVGLFFSFIQDLPKKPDQSRFTPVSLSQPGDLDEPNTFEVLKDGRVLISERKGAIKMYHPLTKTIRLVATIPVNTKYTSARKTVTEAEEGLLGLTVDPNFETNHWIYTFYSHPTESKFQLTRWDFVNNELVAGSEKILLQFATQRETCCHTGGGMTWDSQGNLYLTVGNNSGTSLSSSTDERPNRVNWDDQRGTANTNSLIGKILRIKPQADGTYIIPKGNLFPPGNPLARPEIYTMGHRNPWRPSIDSKTGYLYFGDIGSDATESSDIGPMGYDELNQARKPGFFGWPYFIGPNEAFPIFDYINGELLDKKDPNKPLNNSINNSGLKELPPLAPAFVYYPYGISEKFPLTGSGSRSAVGGPIYRRADRPAAKRPWPAYYEGKWLATDLARGWIMAISMDASGNYKSMEKFLSDYRPVEPIDIKFGPDGDLYVLEYGSLWFGKSESAKLVRIEYNAGNRKPLVSASANKSGGSVPLKITLSAAGTNDADGDVLKYQWRLTSPGVATQTFTSASTPITLYKAGVYTANLTVTDSKGATNSKSISIIAGNETPTVKIGLTTNSTFFFVNKTLDYTVTVSDKEDGSLTSGTIKPEQVSVSIDYASEGFDYAQTVQAQRSVDESSQFAVAQALMSKSDCKNCHHPTLKNVGPSFTAIAEKYRGDAVAIERLATKIRAGGSGVWGSTIGMPAHPGISQNDAESMVKYIVNISNKNIKSLPIKGTYTTQIPKGDNGNGTFIVRASYTDRGNNTVPKQTSESTIILRKPIVNASLAEFMKGATVKVNGADGLVTVIPTANSHIGFRKLDLTGIKEIELKVATSPREKNLGGIIEIRTGSPSGLLIGQALVEPAEDQALSKAVKTEIKETSGLNDLYFIFKNDKAKPIEPLMSITTISFNNEKK